MFDDPIVAGGYPEMNQQAQRKRMMADLLMQKSLQPRQQIQQGRIAAPASLAPALGQIGEALLARRAGKAATRAEGMAASERGLAMADALEGTGMAQYQQALDSGVDPNIVAAMIQQNAPKEENPTDDMREYQAAVMQGYEGSLQEWLQKSPQPTDDMREYEMARQQGYDKSFQDWLIDQRRAGASSTNVNLPSMGSIPPGWKVVYDQNRNPVSMEPIPGGPVEAEQRVAAEEAARDQEREAERERSEVEQADLMTQEIDRAMDTLDSSWLSGAGGLSWIKDIPVIGSETDAKKLEGLLTTIKANIGFDRLNQMRQQSPTGGALGQVSERELTYLQSVAGTLEQDQRPEVLKDNLNRLWNAYQDVIHGPGNGPQRRQLSFSQPEPARVSQADPVNDPLGIR